ncbi:MAG: hypothetical protein GXP26_03370 [Planctomycetes bacterium]|nr:hypothetical protein [Planctomycetota bacterium]
MRLGDLQQFEFFSELLLEKLLLAFVNGGGQLFEPLPKKKQADAESELHDEENIFHMV